MLAHLCRPARTAVRATRASTTGRHKGYGIVKKVLWTARNGATISGRVWATKAGPAKRPGIVITNGSVQARRAAVLVRGADAREGGLRRADVGPAGPGPVGQSAARRPTRTRACRRSPTAARSSTAPRTRSTSSSRTRRRRMCRARAARAGLSHAAKQDRRVKAGLNAAYNPFWELLDPTGGHRRPLVRRGGRVVHRAGGPAGQGDRGVGQPRRRPTPSAEPRGAVPVRPVASASRRRSRSRRSACRPTTSSRPRRTLRPRPARQERAVARVLEGGRRHRGADHPRRHALRLRLDPEPGVPGHAARRGQIAWYTTAWFDKYVKRRPERRTRDCSPTAGAPTPRRRPSTPRRRQHVLLLLPLAARHRACRRRAVHVRGHAPGLPGPRRGRRRAGRVRLPQDGTSPDGRRGRACRRRRYPRLQEEAERVVPLHYKVRIVRATIYINGKRVRVRAEPVAEACADPRRRQRQARGEDRAALGARPEVRQRSDLQGLQEDEAAPRAVASLATRTASIPRAPARVIAVEPSASVRPRGRRSGSPRGGPATSARRLGPTGTGRVSGIRRRCRPSSGSCCRSP